MSGLSLVRIERNKSAERERGREMSGGVQLVE